MTLTDANGKPEWAMSKRERAVAVRAQQGLPPKRRRWPWVLLVLVVLAAIGVFVFTRMQPPPPPPVAETPAEPVMQLNPLEVTTLEPQTLERTVKVTGAMQPQRQTALTAKASGTVQLVNVRPGDSVSQGQVLLQIDIESLRVQFEQQSATVEATRAQLVLAQAQLERTQQLVERGVTPSSNLESAQSNVDGLRANVAALESQLRTAEIALENATVIAPFDGVVAARSVEPGQTVAAGAALFTLVDLSRMEVLASAPLNASAAIAPGQRVVLTVESLPGQTFSANVDRINPVAAEGTRTIPVYLTIENPDGVFRGGMFTTGQIVVEEKPDAIGVPPAALREDAQGDYVLKIVDGRAVRQAVTLGPRWSTGGLTEITQGLAAGDTIVTVPLTQLEPDMAVTMVGG